MLGGALAVALGLVTPAMETLPPEGPTIRVRVADHDTLVQIAARYGVTAVDLRRWNGLDGSPAPGEWLVVEPKLFPPLRQMRRVDVAKDDTWDSIAQRYDLSAADLERWNRRLAKRKRPPTGATLVLWLPSGVKEYPLVDASRPLPEVSTPPGGESVGKPHRGRLRHGVPLPESEHYIVRIAYQSFGTSLAVRDIQRALAGFRMETGFESKITIGALSRKVGRRLRPHRSHQSGRDVDVRLPQLPFVEGYKLESHEIDWYATFALIDAFVRTGDVAVIFLERKFFRRLRRVGRKLGASDERIEHVLSHVRHEKGHTGHIHVRFRCAPTSLECDG
jgi:murein endopeptidase